MNCLDSTFLVDLLDPDRSRHEVAKRWIEGRDDEPMYAPTFAIWEVLRGAARLDGVDGVDDLRGELEWLTPLPFSDGAATEAATIEAELREEGNEISVSDYPVAGTARNAGATVITADPDFERVPGLDVNRYDSED